MLSGIGPASELKAAGVLAKHDLPGVGKNLQDHLDICTIAKTPRRLSYDFSLLQEALVGLRYLLTRKGAGTSNAAEAGGFICSGLGDGQRPDVQLHFVPAQLDDHGRNRLPGHGYTVHACALRPASRGEITLKSADPLAHPRIAPNYLTGEGDLELMLEAVRISREIFAQPPFDPYRGGELLPGESARTRAQLVEFIRNKAETIYHPVGTCSMGQDAMSVVDSQLRVHGLEALRVVDASIMPTLVSGNTNAPTVMIAEKASDMIRGLEPAREGNSLRAA
jgi:choline dehydrogenase